MRTIFITGALLIILSSCSHQQYLASKWQQTDNISTVTTSALDYQYDPDKKLFYKVSNDSTNLYVHLKAVDETVQKKLLMAGMTVWIDTLAKNKKQFGIKFPIKNDDGFDQMPQRGMSAQNGEPDFNEMKLHLMERFFDIELTGFTGKGSREIIPAKSKHISAEMYFNKNNHIFYSYKIPYESIGLVYESGKLISINLESGTLSAENRPGGMQSGSSGGRSGGMSGGGPGGMGGGQSGGMGGGMGGGGRSGMQGGPPEGMPDRAEMTAVIKIKLKKVKLL